MTTCIYHGNCADGFAAAWVVRKALGGDIRFHAGRYGSAPPDVTGEIVYIVDFSYTRDVLTTMAATARQIIVLDHHKTAQADLADLKVSNITTVFDMKRSGARLAWDHFFPDAQPPQALLHIEDRDLWRFALLDTREIMAGIFSYPYDFNVWDTLMGLTDLEKVGNDGYAILRKQSKDIRELLQATGGRMEIAGYRVPAANLPYSLASEAGQIMAEGAPFAAVFWDTPSSRQFSLRSHSDGIDVSEVAKAFGGGGHAHAAGFRVTYDHPLATTRLEADEAYSRNAVNQD